MNHQSRLTDFKSSESKPKMVEIWEGKFIREDFLKVPNLEEGQYGASKCFAGRRY